jgi:cation:H+ antiporter
MVESATEIARLWQVPEVIIGLTIVAVGTSLPELASTVAAAYRKQADIAVGNVVGSNLFNILMILGVTGMVKPLDVDASLLRVDLPVMLGFAVAMFLMLLRTATIYRLEGIVLLLAYAGFIGWQAVQAS